MCFAWMIVPVWDAEKSQLEEMLHQSQHGRMHGVDLRRELRARAGHGQRVLARKVASQRIGLACAYHRLQNRPDRIVVLRGGSTNGHRAI